MDFTCKSEMRRIATQTLGQWIEMKDGSKVIHLETDLPIARVFDPQLATILCVNITDFKNVLGDLIIPGEVK